MTQITNIIECMRRVFQTPLRSQCQYIWFDHVVEQQPLTDADEQFKQKADEASGFADPNK